MKRIILTGGGTAGHVTPNIALLPRLKELQYDIHYIGSYNGIEKELISQFGIPYHGISTGKLRRYFSVQNFTDPFRVIKGMGEARKLIKILEPDVIFVISRAGANAICELLALHKPNLLIPLSANASRGDQILNARSFERQGFSMVLEEEELTNETLLSAVHDLYDNREKYIDAMKHSSQQVSIDTIIDLIESVTA